VFRVRCCLRLPRHALRRSRREGIPADLESVRNRVRGDWFA
jgi:hypothetical protein